MCSVSFRPIKEGFGGRYHQSRAPCECFSAARSQPPPEPSPWRFSHASRPSDPNIFLYRNAMFSPDVRSLWSEPRSHNPPLQIAGRNSTFSSLHVVVQRANVSTPGHKNRVLFKVQTPICDLPRRRSLLRAHGNGPERYIGRLCINIFHSFIWSTCPNSMFSPHRLDCALPT